MHQAIKIAKTAAVTVALNGINRELALGYLSRSLAEMTGVGTKISQILGMKSGSPSPIIPLLPLSDVKKIIEEESEQIFCNLASIDQRGHAASIGQTHRAFLRDGRLVCIKIQRPGVAESIRQQLELSFKMLKLSPAKKFELDIESLQLFLTNSINTELDYSNEAQAQESIRQDLSSITNLIIPKVIASTPRLLVQAYEPGADLRSAAAWDNTDLRRSAADTLITAFLKMMLVSGTIHADLHPQNLAFRRLDRPDVILYDFGCVLHLSNDQKSILRALISGQTLYKPGETFQALVNLGFAKDKLKRIPRAETILNSFIEKLLNPTGTSADNLKLGKIMRTELGTETWWFRTAGPPWFLYLMRAIFGILHVLDQFNVSINFRSLISVIDQNHSKISLLNKHAEINYSEKNFHSKHLCVQILEDGKEVVNLQLPARSIEDIENLLPENTATNLQAKGIDLKKIRDDAISSKCAPQTLFRSLIGKRQYWVWLE